MTKRKLTEAEKRSISSERMAKGVARRPDYTVIVTVEDDIDDDGKPIVTVLRMKGSAIQKKAKRKRKLQSPVRNKAI